jgi:cold shock CspA family protein
LIRDRGFGFISVEYGRDIFLYTTALQGMTFYSLIEGQSVVEFDVEKIPKDSRSKGSCAINVQGEKQS